MQTELLSQSGGGLTEPLKTSLDPHLDQGLTGMDTLSGEATC